MHAPYIDVFKSSLVFQRVRIEVEVEVDVAVASVVVDDDEMHMMMIHHIQFIW